MGKKVLHILNTARFSGAENVVVTIIEAFRKMAIDIDFVYVSPDGPIREVLEEKDIPFEPIKKMSVFEIRRVVKKHRPDVIHAHDFTASTAAAFSFVRVPIISHLHNNSPWLKRYCLNSFAYGISCMRYRHIIGVSNSVFSEYVFGRLIKRKASVIGNPLDVSKTEILAETAKAEEGYDVCFLGRLAEPKDPLRFVEIIKKLNEHMPCKGVMIGDGPLRADVESEIRKHSLEDMIVLKGFLNNPYGILKNSKALCAPSKWEGFGLMAVESLSLGVPVAATPVGGLVDIVTDKCGALCRTDDEFEEFLGSLLQDEGLFSQYSNGAKSRAKELDNIGRYCQTLKSFYA